MQLLLKISVGNKNLVALRIIKLALISFTLIFLLVTLISLFIPSHVRISKAIDINSPADSVMALIRDTAQWKHWHPAFQGETGALNTEVNIREVSSTDTLIVMEMSKDEKRKLLNGWRIYSHENREVVTLQWYLDFHLRWYPWEKFGSLFYESSYGAMMENGLGNLKNVAEQ